MRWSCKYFGQVDPRSSPLRDGDFLGEHRELPFLKNKTSKPRVFEFFFGAVMSLTRPAPKKTNFSTWKNMPSPKKTNKLSSNHHFSGAFCELRVVFSAPPPIVGDCVGRSQWPPWWVISRVEIDYSSFVGVYFINNSRVDYSFNGLRLTGHLLYIFFIFVFFDCRKLCVLQNFSEWSVLQTKKMFAQNHFFPTTSSFFIARSIHQNSWNMSQTSLELSAWRGSRLAARGHGCGCWGWMEGFCGERCHVSNEKKGLLVV